MSQIDDILVFNERFVSEKGYLPYQATGRPAKKMTIVTCMDCRLIELLPQALNIKNGDAIMIKSAGGMIEDPYGSTMKSILVSLHELGSEAVYVIGHTDCGMHGLTGEKMIDDMKRQGVSTEALEQVKEQEKDLPHWLNGFQSVDEQVAASVAIVKNHPLLPKNTPIYGMVIDPTSGALRRVQ
ncbi:MAG: carbonic anhydrase [Sporolactobacillus sp.]